MRHYPFPKSKIEVKSWAHAARVIDSRVTAAAKESYQTCFCGVLARDLARVIDAYDIRGGRS
jgi:hypothetical protein